jgi:hypothetical protein
MVEAAIALITEMIETPEAPVRHVVLRGDLMVRGSARVPPEGCVSREGALVWRPAEDMA